MICPNDACEKEIKPKLVAKNVTVFGKKYNRYRDSCRYCGTRFMVEIPVPAAQDS